MSEEKRNPNLEYPDPRPVEWPLNLKKPPSIQEMIRQYVRTELSRRAADAGAESFEDFHDFDVEDEDGELVTQHELAAMSPEEAGFDPDAEVIDERKEGARARARGGETGAPVGGAESEIAGGVGGAEDGARAGARGTPPEGQGPKKTQ